MPLADRVRTGPTHEPLRVFLHGVEGVGKTTFASGAPNAIFIGPEDGGGDLDIARIVTPTWADFLTALTDLTSDPHPYQTLVIDTVDFVERLCQQHITKGSGSLEKVEGGFGKGYKVAAEEMAKAIQSIDVLRHRRRMAVIGLCHTSVVKFDDPTEASYDRYQPNLDKRVAPLWTGWADVVLFVNYDVKVRTAQGGQTPEVLKKGKAVDRAPDRVIYTERRPAFDAKNRQGLPPELPLSWADFSKAIEWDRRAAACRGAGVTEGGNDLKAAMTDAAKRGWTKAQMLSVLDSYGYKSGAEVKPEHVAGIVLAFSKTPPTTTTNPQPEAK